MQNNKARVCEILEVLREGLERLDGVDWQLWQSPDGARVRLLKLLHEPNGIP
jgi:hypothetical protein